MVICKSKIHFITILSFIIINFVIVYQVETYETVRILQENDNSNNRYRKQNQNIHSINNNSISFNQQNNGLIHGNEIINSSKKVATSQTNTTLRTIKPKLSNVQNNKFESIKRNNLTHNKIEINEQLISKNNSSIERRNYHNNNDQNNKRKEIFIDSSFDEDRRIPVWNMAHMINSIKQIDPALATGANAIESDISFDKNGYPIESYHGFPCDCGRHCHFREDFVKFVKYISTITERADNSSNLQLILFDLKLKELNSEQKEKAGYHLAEIVYTNIYKKYSINNRRNDLPLRDKVKIDNYYKIIDNNNNNNQGRRNDYDDQTIFRPPIKVVFSINHVNDAILIKSIFNYIAQNRLDFMRKQVGFDIGMNDKLSDIIRMWDDSNGLTFNIWQGDGLTNCANIFRGYDRLDEAISIRNGQGHFRKVYYWTADVLYHIRSLLRLGVDAILTNQPQRVVKVLEESEFKLKYRLATPFDDPFTQFMFKSSSIKNLPPPTIDEAIETVTNIKNTSADFIKTIPDGLTAIGIKVHNSIKSYL